MQMQWLDDVLVLLEEGNMTRAAARRNITQPAFSRRIRGFESWLGVHVLERGVNRIDLSPALRANEAEIRTLVTRLRDLRGKITHFDPARSTLGIAAQHATVHAIFADMALQARHVFPALGFRLRAANLRDCASMFLRGDTQLMLCYESEHTGPLPFGETIARALCSVDYLVPVVGGSLRFRVRDKLALSLDTPSIIYPEQSYFGEVLNGAERTFGTLRHSRNPVCETAFSGAVKEMAINGLGVGWIPFSMAHREIESGDLISLAEAFGKERLEIAVYDAVRNDLSTALLDLWAIRQRHFGLRVRDQT